MTMPGDEAAQSGTTSVIHQHCHPNRHLHPCLQLLRPEPRRRCQQRTSLTTEDQGKYYAFWLHFMTNKSLLGPGYPHSCGLVRPIFSPFLTHVVHFYIGTSWAKTRTIQLSTSTPGTLAKASISTSLLIMLGSSYLKLCSAVLIYCYQCSLIRTIGAASTVLLKNTNGALPLNKPKTIGIIGNGAGSNPSGPNG